MNIITDEDGFVEVVLNEDPSYLSLSKAALDRLVELGWDRSPLSRFDPNLVRVVKELGNKACNYPSKITVVPIHIEKLMLKLFEYPGSFAMIKSQKELVKKPVK